MCFNCPDWDIIDFFMETVILSILSKNNSKSYRMDFKIVRHTSDTVKCLLVVHKDTISVIILPYYYKMWPKKENQRK